MEDLSEEDFNCVVAAIVSMIVERDDPIPQHDSELTGRDYYEELMATASYNRFHNVCRMEKQAFRTLLHILETEGGLVDNDTVIAGEKIMILIDALCGWSNRTIAERWQHSGSTISICIQDVIRALLKCKRYFFAEPEDLPDSIRNNPKYFPFFRDCIGALDGCHISAVVSPEHAVVFRNRKQQVSQNMLGVVNFQMIFTYALVGWEGSGHDGNVFNDAKTKGLPMRQGKYWLGDAGYALSKWVLTPYRGVRYHLKEFQDPHPKPMNKEELFNLRHSSLRNVIERTFGVLKKRFPLLSSMHSYTFQTQKDLVVCALMLHNFIREHAVYEDPFDDNFIQERKDADDDADDVDNAGGAMSARQLYAWRDGIAQAMWAQYQAELVRRG